MILDLRASARAERPLIPDLPHLADAAIQTWRGRMVNEYQSSFVFSALALQAEALGLAASVADELCEFAQEERQHGVLCGAVVEALGHEARALVAPPRPMPEHAGVSALEAWLRNILSVSCLSETVAVALIGAERIEMPDSPLRELLTRIWSDEVGHARFGWRVVNEMVPALGALERRRLSLYLRAAFRHLEQHELAHLPIASRPPAEGAALGLCSGEDARTLFYETVEQAILPALEALQLQSRAAWNARHDHPSIGQPAEAPCIKSRGE
ncbi:MAG TPA: ferritin-like domain-containing protein [Polyangiaceae bacterium]